MKLLHILNGDSTLALFKKAKIRGEIFVVRDVLCEGPCNYNFGTAAFIKERTTFMSQQYKVEEEEFTQKVFSELIKIDSLDWEECALWFEYDLFCQINMMAILAFLEKFSNRKISLICVGKEEGYEYLVGLGELPFTLYPGLFENRVELTVSDFSFAKGFWQTYIGKDPSGFAKYILEANSTFVYFQKAIQRHLQRFPDSKTGIGLIEMTILAYINSGINSNHSIVGKLLNEDWEYGFGDLQYFNILESMTEFYRVDDGLFEINPFGLNILEGKSKYDGKMYKDQYLGGYNMNEYEYDAQNQRLITR